MFGYLSVVFVSFSHKVRFFVARFNTTRTVVCKAFLRFRRGVFYTAGLYLDGKRLAQFVSGANNVTVELPPTAAGRVTLKVVCAGWIPA